MKTFLAGLLAALLLVGGVTAAQALSADSEPAVVGADNIVIRGGVFHLGSGTNFYLEQNSAHAAVGVTGYRVTNGCDLQIDLDRQADERIVAAIVEEDETVSRLGVTAGISGGVDQANVYLYKDGVKVCANSTLFNSLSNLWVQLTYVRVPAA